MKVCRCRDCGSNLYVVGLVAGDRATGDDYEFESFYGWVDNRGYSPGRVNGILSCRGCGAKLTTMLALKFRAELETSSWQEVG